MLENGDIQRWEVDRFHIGPPQGMAEKLYLNMIIGGLLGIVVPITIGVLLIQVLGRLINKYRSRN
ncbi:MAG: hypothetical protein HND44_23325 [Chloroflexi bacterium]|nr:hypothetical protein [Ardenticatenaceae bacterium]NOG37475.1 hypothetical protein [Chloroflexota bacterium]